MTKASLFFILSVPVVAVSGCSSSPKDEAHISSPTNQIHEEVLVWDLTVVWGNIGRGGAAYRQPGYINALWEKSPNEQTRAGHSVPPSQGVINALNDMEAIEGKGYSLYELSRWERYCSAGRNMDERDWEFVTKEGVNNVPSNQFENCSPPEYSYQQYKTAWAKFCHDRSITNAERQIVRSSVRPSRFKSTCKK